MEFPPSFPQQHVAVCPSAGIGHLTPFLRLAAMLDATSSVSNGGRNLKVTLVIIRPTLSSAEADQITMFLSSHPIINSFEFHSDPATSAASLDPFFRQYAAVSSSAHRLVQHLSTISPPLDAVFTDLMLASGLNAPLAALGILTFTFITTSARFFSLMASGPHHVTDFSQVNIPECDIPPFMFDQAHVFHKLIETNCRRLKYASSIVLNTFSSFEQESISSLQNGMVVADLPPIFPIGPLLPLRDGHYSGFSSDHRTCGYLHWLNEQPLKSVIYVSFGSRTALSGDQIREVGKGLERSGVRFLWVLKTTIVDKEEKGDAAELLEDGFLKRTKGRGLMVNEWVSQEDILAHPSVRAFVSHCGWNSVMEAGHRGVPVIAWPQHGDQRINAMVVEEAGLGVWERGWKWGGERLVTGEEIRERIEEVMRSTDRVTKGERVREEARKAWEDGGSSNQWFKRIICMCKGSAASK